MNTLCIYHANCADGFGAAWVIAMALHEVELFPGYYGEIPPTVTGRDVLIVDFSYPRDILLSLAAEATSITIIDHHKTAQAELVDLPANVTAIFDMEHSGAMLSWRYVFGGEEPPVLLRHIEDNDLWRFALPGTREIMAAVLSYPYDLETWDHLMGENIEVLRHDGGAIRRKQRKDLEELLLGLTQRMSIAGYDVPVANLPYLYASDAGHALASEAPFAACYWDTAQGRQFSLRSRAPDGLDVSAIAQQFGGGGHKHASGFRVPFDHPLARHPRSL